VDLDRAALGRLLHEAFGGPDGLTPLGAGWDFDCFRFRGGDGRARVARVPARRDVVPSLEAEVAFLAALPPPLAALAPAPERLLPAAGPLPVPVLVYPALPGVPLGSLPPAPEDGTALAPALGAALARLHRWTAPVPCPGTRQPAGVGVEARLRAERAAWRNAETGGAPPVELVLAVLEAPAHDAPATVTVHGDLDPGHVLVDPDTRRLTGILDWTDAEPGDPALDHAALAASRGPAFAAALREASGDAIGDRTFALRLARTALLWAADAVLEQCLRRGRPEPEAVTSLKRALAACQG
jgi:aminoglycoside phosphotransferase (APT) family kinase protein